MVNLFQPNAAFHIKTNHLIGSANQITGLYMKCSTRLKWVKQRNKVSGINYLRWSIIALLEQNLRAFKVRKLSLETISLLEKFEHQSQSI